MKIQFLFLSLLLLVGVSLAEEAEVNAQGEVKSAEPDCEQQCLEKVTAALAPVNQQKQGLQNDLNRVKQELDKETKDKEGLKKNLDGQVKEKEALLKEIEELRKSLEQTRQKLKEVEDKAGSHQQAVTDARRQLSQAKSKAASLEKELQAAKEEIKELANVSFVGQLKKEIMALWASMIGFIQKLLAKKEQNETKKEG